MTIQDLLEKVETLHIEEAIPELVKETDYDIEALNQYQLILGTNSKGEKLKEYRSEDYAKEKYMLNPAAGFGFPDLLLTGSFYNNMLVEVSSTGFEVDSMDSKSEDLKDKYGDAIFGLTPDNTKVYALGVFYTALQKYVTLKTGLEFT